MAQRRLVLVRHAEAAAGPDDAERVLTGAGTAHARGVGRWLVEHGVAPDVVVVSPARRAGETWRLAAADARTSAEPVIDERIYRNTLDDLLAVVREADPDAATLLVVGHNPSISALAETLDDTARREFASGLPPAAVAVFAIGVAWSDVDAAAGTLTGFAGAGY